MVTLSALVWFGETWTISELRHYWLFLTKKAQTYITSFETLAQLVLIQAAHYRLRYQHASFKLPSGVTTRLFFVSCALVSLSLSVTGERRRETKRRQRRCCTTKLMQGETRSPEGVHDSSHTVGHSLHKRRYSP